MVFNRCSLTIVSAFVVVLICSHAEAYDPLDPTGNITIKWDVLSWTLDGYVAVVDMTNFQMYRPIMSPGWKLGWTWAKEEVIWAMVGAQTTKQGDCSMYKGNIPHSCKRNPKIVDLHLGVPSNQKVDNCCKGGVLASWGQDPSAAVSSFQLSVGSAGTTNRTVRLPKNFTLLAPGKDYICGPAKIVRSTTFLSTDGRRKTQARMTWTVTCTNTRSLTPHKPTCCVSISSYYNSKVTPSPICSCGCQKNKSCVKSVVGKKKSTSNAPLLQCTKHMCPIKVHWHVKNNYKESWRVQISITNFNYRFNYTQWTLAVQHPNLNNITKVSSFVYKPVRLPYKSTIDTGMFYGIKSYNDVLKEAGAGGEVHSDLILGKDKKSFTFKHGWGFPWRVYFNGDECLMPSPEDFPHLSNSTQANSIAKSP